MKRLIGTVGLAGVVVCAYAMATFSGVFGTTYKVAKDSNLTKAKCGLCHVKAMGGALNPYGKDLEAAIKKTGTKKLTPAILKSVESLDSDKDGATNIAEIKADKLPGVK